MELLCRCDDIADDSVELRVLKGLLTAATSSHIHLHGQVQSLLVSRPLIHTDAMAIAFALKRSYTGSCARPLFDTTAIFTRVRLR